MERRNKKYIIPNESKFELIDNKKEKLKIFNFFLKNKYNKLEKTFKKNYLKSKFKKIFLKNFFLQNDILVMYSKEKIIMSCVSYKIKNRVFYYLFPAYDIFYNTFAPGQQIINYILFMQNQKFESIDFTIGDEKYKKYWSNDLKFYNDSIISTNITGLIFFFVIIIKNKINKKFYNFFLMPILKKFRIFF